MPHNFTQNSVAELREMLIQSKKYTKEEAENIKGKTNLVDAVLKLNGAEENETEDNTLQDVFEEAKSEIPEVIISDNDENVNLNSVISYNDAEWHDYVMSQFLEGELFEGYPTLGGLRRVTELLLGSIVESGPTQVFPATHTDAVGRASVVYKVVFDWFNTGFRRDFSACADAWEGNTDKGYNLYPLCIAESRAEARALRRALKLQMAAAEEMIMSDRQKGVKEASSAGEWQETDRISEAQVAFIEKKCSDFKLDVIKYINSGKEQYKEIREISRATALKMIERLNQYQTSEESSVEIPTELKVSDR